MFDFLTPHLIYLTLHIFGVAIGAGAAYMSDAIFLSSVKDKVFSSSEIRILKLLSKFVWIGLVLLVVSGIFLFLPNSEMLMGSSKFLAKMTLVLVVIINGVVFHIKHIPFIARMENQRLADNAEFQKRAATLIASGALSMVSWTFIIIFGAIRGVPYSYLTIMLVYLAVLFVAIGAGLLMKKRIFGGAQLKSEA